jgi:hypothetical protein
VDETFPEAETGGSSLIIRPQILFQYIFDCTIYVCVYVHTEAIFTIHNLRMCHAVMVSEHVQWKFYETFETKFYYHVWKYCLRSYSPSSAFV